MQDALLGWAGLIGVALYLGAYAALQLGLLKGGGPAYTWLNLAAAAFVLTSLTADFNLASALIQISWITISLVGLVRHFVLSRALRLRDEERRMIDAALPGLPVASARTLLRAGAWIDVPDGFVLLHEDAPVDNLYYIASGRAHVTLQGRALADLDAGFAGEIAVLEGQHASATVTARAPMRLFVISRDALDRLRRSDAALRDALEASMARDTGRKLRALNARVAQAPGASGSE